MTTGPSLAEGKLSIEIAETSGPRPLSRGARFAQLSLRFVLVMGTALAVVYAFALAALRDYDRAVPGLEIPAVSGPLAVAKNAALTLAAQVLPLYQPGAATVAPGRVFSDCDGCPEMIEVPAGYFLMGSTLFERDRYNHLSVYPRSRFEKLRIANREGPRIMAEIPRPFAIMRFELTYAEWEAAQRAPDWFRETGRIARIPKFAADAEANDTVTGIDWYDARAYGRWLSAQTGKTYRLPSEAEWEYAARAGSTTTYPWGDTVGLDHAACLGTSSIWDEQRVGPGGLHPPNGFGIYDMIGNGWEWAEDCYTGNHTALQATGRAETRPACDFAVLKGGSAMEEPWQCRSGMRVDPHRFNGGEGSTIRLVRELSD